MLGESQPFEKAEQCRRLAATIADERARQALLTLAIRYEAEAAAGNQPIPTQAS